MMRFFISAALFWASAHAMTNLPGYEGLTMRKEQIHDGSVDTSVISIDQHGNMVRKKGRSSPARARTVAKAKLCDVPCFHNVKVATLMGIGSDKQFKTMRLKGCKDESFHFDGCDQKAPAAAICTNSEHAPTGVRVLKDSHDKVVGYGSCCIAGHNDEVVESTLSMCESPAAEPTAKLVLEAKTSTKDADLPGPNTSATDSGVWASLKNATSVEQGLAMLPQKLQFVPLFIGCVFLGAFATCSAALLMYSHLKAGARITGSFTKLHESSATFLGLLWPVPVFILMGLMGIIMPEMAPAWQFLQALMMTATFFKFPAMILKCGGGRLQLERSLATAERNREPAHIFSQRPFCFLGLCVPSKPVEMQDLKDLQMGVYIACCLLPVISFMEMVCTLETSLVASLTHPWMSHAAPNLVILARVLEVFFIGLVMAAIRGMTALVEAANPKAAEQMNLQRKSTYCQFFLFGLRLLPIGYHLVECVWLQSVLNDSRRAIAARSSIVCAAALYCVHLGWRAFTVDTQHYPELKATGLTEDVNQKQRTLKPVLDVLQFCPFCGSGDLQLESDATSSADTAMASCPQCGARQLPVNLIVHRDRATAEACSSASCKAPSQDKGLSPQ